MRHSIVGTLRYVVALAFPGTGLESQARLGILLGSLRALAGGFERGELWLDGDPDCVVCHRAMERRERS